MIKSFFSKLKGCDQWLCSKYSPSTFFPGKPPKFSKEFLSAVYILRDGGISKNDNKFGALSDSAEGQNFLGSFNVVIFCVFL